MFLISSESSKAAIILAVILLGLLEVVMSLTVTFGIPLGETEECLCLEDAIYKARIAAAKGPYVLLLGDSVLLADALKKSGYHNALQECLSAKIIHNINEISSSHNVLTFAMPGALIGDYVALLNLLYSEHSLPSLVIIQIDYRSVSPIHQNNGYVSRDWLYPYSPKWISKIVKSSHPYKTKNWITDVAYNKLLLKSNSYIYFRRVGVIIIDWITNLFSEKTNDDTNDLLRFNISKYYTNSKPIKDTYSLKLFEELLDNLLLNKIPSFVFITPSNLNFVGSQANYDIYNYNMDVIMSWFLDRYRSNKSIELVSFERRIPEKDFIDHCHLTPEGNELIAQLVKENVAVWWSLKMAE